MALTPARACPDRPPDGTLHVVETLRGRVAELSVLQAVSDGARDGAGGVAVLEGPAGIGKSRLLAEACRGARAHGVTVATGRADELDQVTPWGALLRALSASRPPLFGAAQLDEVKDLVDLRLAVVDRMRQALESAAERGPLVIALDDLQWADPQTLHALGWLPEQLFSYPVGWLLACRRAPASGALATLLRRLDDLGAARLPLTSLAAPDALALARDVAGDDAEVSAQQVETAGGNPFYLIELFRSGRSTVDDHLRSLSPACRRLLSMASVLGREFTVAEIAAMTGEPAGRLLSAVEEALSAEVVIELDDRLVFRHDLLRQAVYERLPKSARVALHSDAAAALRRTGASAIRIASQLKIGALPGDEAAIENLRAAAAELAPTSPRAAAELAVRALDLIGPRDARQPAVVGEAVNLLLLAGRLDDAIALGERHVGTLRPQPEVEAGLQLALRHAWVYDRAKDYPTPFPEHLKRDPAVDPATVALAEACDHVGAMYDGRSDQADRVFEQARRAVAAGERPFEFTTANVLWMYNAMLSGRMGESLRRAEAGSETARAFEGLRSSGVHETTVAGSLAAMGRLARAEAVLREAAPLVEATERPFFTNRLQWLRATILQAQGQLDNARAEARAAAAVAEDLMFLSSLSYALCVLAESALRLGETAQARAALARFEPLEREMVATPDRYWIAALLADARGDGEVAAEAFASLLKLIDADCFALAVWHHHRLPQLTAVALRFGHGDAARQFARAAGVLADRNPDVPSLVAAGAQAAGLVKNDVELLRAAVDGFAAGECRLAEAVGREDLARMIAARSDPEHAVAALEAAYEAYLRIGAQRDVARMRASLRAFGVRKRKVAAAPQDSGWAGLTRSERAVVEIVARGRTNKEAAAELFVSPETINTHLRHAFTKLGIRSRVELARLVAQRGE